MTVREAKKPKAVPSVQHECYSARITKASALLDDVKTLLLHWDVADSVANNLSRIRHENVFGKASRSRVEDILTIFRQRYLTEDEVVKALVALVQDRFSKSSLDRILYFHAARSDSLLHDVVIEILGPMQASGIVDIDSAAIQRRLSEWVKKGLTAKEWSQATTIRVSRSVLTALRDFGVLQGAVNKRIAPAYMPVTAFAYIAFYLKQHQPSGAKLLEHPDWRLFFLNPELVERFLLEANQHDLLEYHAAGSVTRLTFPAETLEEYANVLAKKSH